MAPLWSHRALLALLVLATACEALKRTAAESFSNSILLATPSGEETLEGQEKTNSTGALLEDDAGDEGEVETEKTEGEAEDDENRNPPLKRLRNRAEGELGLAHAKTRRNATRRGPQRLADEKPTDADPRKSLHAAGSISPGLDAGGGAGGGGGDGVEEGTREGGEGVRDGPPTEKQWTVRHLGSAADEGHARTEGQQVKHMLAYHYLHHTVLESTGSALSSFIFEKMPQTGSILGSSLFEKAATTGSATKGLGIIALFAAVMGCLKRCFCRGKFRIRDFPYVSKLFMDFGIDKFTDFMCIIAVHELHMDVDKEMVVTLTAGDEVRTTAASYKDHHAVPRQKYPTLNFWKTIEETLQVAVKQGVSTLKVDIMDPGGREKLAGVQLPIWEFFLEDKTAAKSEEWLSLKRTKIGSKTLHADPRLCISHIVEEFSDMDEDEGSHSHDDGKAGFENIKGEELSIGLRTQLAMAQAKADKDPEGSRSLGRQGKADPSSYPEGHAQLEVLAIACEGILKMATGTLGGLYDHNVQLKFVDTEKARLGGASYFRSWRLAWWPESNRKCVGKPEASIIILDISNILPDPGLPKDFSVHYFDKTAGQGKCRTQRFVAPDDHGRREVWIEAFHIFCKKLRDMREEAKDKQQKHKASRSSKQSKRSQKEQSQSEGSIRSSSIADSDSDGSAYDAHESGHGHSGHSHSKSSKQSKSTSSTLARSAASDSGSAEPDGNEKPGTGSTA